MASERRCPACGASWPDARTCQDHFYQMGIWEFEYPDYIRQVHHLMVLCYHLQHPSLYSPEGLSGAKQLLEQFLVKGITTQQVRRQNRAALDSGRRQYKITGTPSNHGTYADPVPWTLTAADVIANGVEQYCDSVRAWAQSIYEALKASGNLA